MRARIYGSEAGIESDEEFADLLETEEEPAAEFDIDALGLEDEADTEKLLVAEEETATEKPPEEAVEEEAEELPAEDALSLEGISRAVEEVAQELPAEEELFTMEEEEAVEEPPEEALEEVAEEVAAEEELFTMEGEEGAEEAPEEALKAAMEERLAGEDLDLEGISRAVEEAAEEPEAVSEEKADEILDFDLLDAEEKPGEEEVEFEEIGLDEELVAEEAAPVEEEAPAEEEPLVERIEVGEEAEEEMPPPVAEERPMPPPTVMKVSPPRKRISAPVMILLVLALLAGGAYGGYVYLKSTGTSIPFLESLMGTPEPAIVDPGNLQIAVLEQEIGTEFVENSAAGQLFVIRGQVRNDYPDARNFIMVKGVLYSKDGQAVQQKNIYCGNVLADSDLQATDKASIEAKLLNRFGDQRSNFQVPPGKELPFMVVFSDLPPDFGEFSVEVVSSAPAQ
jgi:pilus assembly protein FimV